MLSFQSVGQGNNDTIQPSALNYSGSGGTTGANVVACPLGAPSPVGASPVNATSAPSYLTPAIAAVPLPLGFAASGMMVRVTGNGGDGNPTVPVTLSFSVNGQQGAIAINLPANFTFQPVGLVYADSSHQDWMPPYENVAFQISYPAGCTYGTGASALGICFTGVQWAGVHAGPLTVPLASSPCRNSAAYCPPNIYVPTRVWLNPVGELIQNTGNPGQAQVVMPVAGYWGNLTVKLDHGGNTTDTNHRVFRSFISPTYLSTDPAGGAAGYPNGASGMPYGAQIVNFNDVSTSYRTFSDSSHVDFVLADDLIGVEYYGQSNSITCFYDSLSSTFTSADGHSSPLLVGKPTTLPTGTSDIWQQNSPGGTCRTSQNTSETMALTPMAGAFYGLAAIWGAVAGGDQGAVFYANETFDKHTAYGSQMLSALQVGVNQDTSHQDWLPAGEAWSVRYKGVPSNGSNYTINSQSLGFRSVSPGGVLGIGI